MIKFQHFCPVTVLITSVVSTNGIERPAVLFGEKKRKVSLHNLL